MRWFCRFAFGGFSIIPCLNKDFGSGVSSNKNFSSKSSQKLVNAVRWLKRIVGLINTFFSPIVVVGWRSCTDHVLIIEMY